ncbi:MAG: ABC transporter ATP-binding protein [Caldilineaceae bacterium]|nr:ABC transporter ATP-binding protein [Caldilineaceae bacterium]
MAIGESGRTMLTVEHVSKAYTAGQPVLNDISLRMAEGEVLCLLGPSGCGKSTLLRIIAGLETADTGTLTLDGRDLTSIPVHRRHFGLMFQDFALFPHRTVAENVAFGLRMAGMARKAIAARVAEVLALVALEGYEDRSIFALSGGERQRVALARSLAPNPRLLMLDEPLGSLDRTLRDELVTELRSILKAIHVTALYVTHDQQEAFTIADRLVVMRKGEIEQIGAPAVVYQQPASAFVARFLGFHNLLSFSHAQRIIPNFPLEEAATETPLLIMIRPDAVKAIACGSGQPVDAETAPWLVGRVQQLVFLGAAYRLTITATHAAVPGALHLSFDIPTIQIAPHLAGLTVDSLVALSLESSAICSIQP